MKCPQCKEPTLVISERQGIEIDYCPECRGVWLDRGELDKILEKSQLAEAVTVRAAEPSREYVHAPAPQYGRENQHGYYQKPYKKKKSFFEELFD